MSDGDDVTDAGDGQDLDHVDELISEAKQGAQDNADQLRPEPAADADLTGRTEVEREEAEVEARAIEEGDSDAEDAEDGDTEDGDTEDGDGEDGEDGDGEDPADSDPWSGADPDEASDSEDGPPPVGQ